VFVTDAGNREVLEYDGASGAICGILDHPPSRVMTAESITRSHSTSGHRFRFHVWTAPADLRCCWTFFVEGSTSRLRAPRSGKWPRADTW